MDNERVRQLLAHCIKDVSGVIKQINVLMEEKIGLTVIQPTHKDINNITRKIDNRFHSQYIVAIKS